MSELKEIGVGPGWQPYEQAKDGHDAATAELRRLTRRKAKWWCKVKRWCKAKQ